MKPSVIADTSALISLASISDGNHTEATNISISIKKNDYPLIIPGEIFTETINTLGKKPVTEKQWILLVNCSSRRS